MNNIQQNRGLPLKTFLPGMFLLATVLLGSCLQKGETEKKGSITIGMEATAVNSLIYIAENRGCFAANGLDVTINDSYPSGAASTEGMLKDEVDISTAAEFALVRYAFENKPTLTIGSIDMFMHMKLIGRKDRGIENASDLEGKRIGVPINTAADFKLGRFLDLNGVNKSKITIVDVQAPDAVETFLNGDVDAIITWQPIVMTLQDRLGEHATTLAVQSGQPMYCILFAIDKWVQENPDLVQRFLKSLMQAEDFLIKHPDHARAIVQKRLGYDEGYLETIWSEHQFTLRLDQSLILALEDQARWMIENKLTKEKNVPYFLEFIHEDGLKTVKPLSTSIIR